MTDDNKDKGYIALYRSMREHYLYPNHRKFTDFEAWIDLLLMVNYKEGKMMIDKSLITINRGETISSELILSGRWFWSRGVVRNFLKILQKDGMILRETTTKYTKITICNYDSYQNIQPTKKQRANNQQTTEQQQTDTNNKDNKDNKDNNRGIIPPKIEWVESYCLERKNNIDAEKFFNHYQSKGWMIGKSKMKDWQASVRTWENRNSNNTEQQKPTVTIKRREYFQG